MTSFSITNNEGIRNYLNGIDSYVPTQELIYLHTHPLIQPNFLGEIDKELREVSLLILDGNIRGAPITELITLGESIGSSFAGSITIENAEVILQALRSLYQLCKKIRRSLDA